MESGKYKKISFKYAIPEEKFRNKALVVLAGIPGEPKTYPYIDNLVTQGYAIFYPQIEGTWDSEGVFLDRSPAESIDEFIEYLYSGAELNGKYFKANQVNVISSSFGGAVALSLKDKAYLKKICALSPVVSFRQVKGIETLNAYIQEKYAANYRYKREGWDKLIGDQILSPLKLTTLPPHKIMLVAGKEDKQININDLAEYSKKYSIQNFLIIDNGHLTPSRIDEALLSKIIEFFEKA